MAFMFETRYPQRVSALRRGTSRNCRSDYADCWAGLDKRSTPDRP